MMLGKLIADYRHRGSLQQQVVAEQIGITSAVLGRIERGETVQGDSLTKVILWALKDRAPVEEPQAQLPLEGKEMNIITEARERLDVGGV